MGKLKWIKPFFVVAALYEGILGLIFLVIPLQIFNMLEVTPPNHIGYVQFPAFLLVAFSIMFFNIARDPIANKNLILYGIFLKFSYCSVVFPHWLAGSIPSIWVFFAFCDLAFLALFIMAFYSLKKRR